MLQDYCTWDDDYNQLVQSIRSRLARLASPSDRFTTVLMQGSGSFGVEAALGSLIPPHGKVLIADNGAYGARMVKMCETLRIPHHVLHYEETEPVSAADVNAVLLTDSAITHVAIVHCETTTGLLNPVAAVGAVVREHKRKFIVDAMSSFGGIPLTMEELHADCLISSANKCIQGVPGFSFVICDRQDLKCSAAWARSLVLNLHDQWKEMEEKQGKWRYTSPTHVVRAFVTALDELEQEGGPCARHARYAENHRLLIEGMLMLGFQPLLPSERQSPIISSFLYPNDPAFTFEAFYYALKRRRFVIYPGKISRAPTFRIGVIGHVFPQDIQLLLRCMEEAVQELVIRVKN